MKQYHALYVHTYQRILGQEQDTSGIGTYTQAEERVPALTH